MAEATSPTLNDTDRQQVQATLADFERNWNGGKLAEMLPRLPPAGQPLRAVMLLGLIRIDLHRQWQGGRHNRVESYLELCPELGTLAQPPMELIQAEFDARRQANQPADVADFMRRFPAQAEQIRTVLEATMETATGSAAPAMATTETVVHPAAGRRGGLPAEFPCNFGRYRLLRVLGRGGMGAVYLAHDDQLDRPVALKVPLIQPTDGPDVLPRFYREARAAATLRHANICPVYDVGEIDGIPYLTMAFIEGTPLADMVKGKKQLPQRQAAELVRQTALAMQEAHRRGVIHRDLKPANIHITPTGEPVIMDFGIARRTDKDGERLTRTGQLMGTPEFMAPEQARGDTEATGPLSDVFSLGVILYRLLAGRVPFEGQLLELLVKITTEDPTRPSNYRPELDRRLEEICLKAMSRVPADRFATMGDFAGALESYLQHAPADAPADEATTIGSHPVVVTPVSLPAGSILPGGAPPVEPKSAWQAVTTSDTAITPPPAPPTPRRGWGVVVGVLAALLVVGPLAYWLLTRPAPVPPTTGAVAVPVTGPRATVPASAIDTPSVDLTSAQEAFAGKDYERAVALLDKALQREPNDGAAVLLRGRAQQARGELDKAIADYTNALRFPAQQRGETYRLRGLALLAKQQPDAALKDLSAAIDLDRRDAAALAGRAEANLALKKYDAAIADARNAEEIDNGLRLDRILVQAYAGRGLLQIGQKQYPQAVATFSEAIALDPKGEALRMRRGDAYRGQEEFARAIDDYLAAWRLNPRTPEIDRRLDETYAQLLERYLRMKDYAGALDAVSGKIKAQPASPWGYYHRGKVYHACDGDGDAARAVEDYTRAGQLDQKLAADLPRRLGESYARLGESYFRRKDYEGAVAEFDRRLKEDNKNSWAYTQRGRAYQLQGEQKQALADFDAAIKLDATDALTHRYRGDAYAELGQLAEAVKDFETAVALNPDDVRSWSQYLHGILGRGNQRRFHDKCNEMLARFKNAEDPSTLNLAAWLGAMVPDAAADTRVPVQMAETAWPKAPGNSDIFYRNTLAAAQYRADNAKEAVKHLEAIAQLREQRKDQRGNVNDWIFLGLAYHKVGDPKARASLERALRGIDQEMALKTCTWNRRVELEHLRREVEELLKKPKK
ncbi:hypothetical protein AYO44_02685 [Planctomycetaceae bacterium SCGC AG-212-F19]|nr:hypothetical protein AYO44_02685 [Planctomycetaceae bacterium SCGC AG-212-F19]